MNVKKTKKVRVLVNFDPELEKTIREYAKKQNRSRSGQIVHMIESYLNQLEGVEK